MGGCIRELGGHPIEIGGVSDHAHLVFGLKATHRLADVVREIKSASSGWVHREVGSSVFSWQEGYGGFTASERDLDGLLRYVRNQEEHHRQRTFEEEYRALLEEHHVEFDERYLW
jgi:hypothetical protein